MTGDRDVGKSIVYCVNGPQGRERADGDECVNV